MKRRYDLSKLRWKLSGWTPHLWRMDQCMEIGASPQAEVPSVPAKVPGSVQQALLDAAVLPDWNVGLNFRECEWVENRHWIYETLIPDEWIETGVSYRLNCLGLDYSGEVILNGRLVSEFRGSHIPHVFDLTPHLCENGNVLRIVFDLPPRWLGQFGYTSRMTDWKVRFNYTWDWTARLVQIGIWDSVFLEATDGREIEEFRCTADADPQGSSGSLRITGKVWPGEGAQVRIRLSSENGLVREKEIDAGRFNAEGVSWEGLPVKLWWPNMEGDRPLYDTSCVLTDKDGVELDRTTRRIGFRNIAWLPCEGAPENADPWICAVNGRPIFLQGVNWVPVRPNFADVTEDDYRKRLELYRDLGMNILRVWGGSIPEKECFYNLCDELGLLVWQEFPLSSSGVDNWPPGDRKSVDEIAEIAESYILRRQHHASLAIWCGGNELIDPVSKPVDAGHPMIQRLQQVVRERDPNRRFLATSASGPSEWGQAENFGKGVHWDVHGPWKAEGKLSEGWTDYWANDDALFRSELGAPGASPVEIIRKSAGGLDPMPANASNPLWRRASVWWIEWDQFIAEIGRQPESLEEYVEWSQERQKEALSIAVGACKGRFPRCGGVILWMGHDCFPCTANTSIVDFDGTPKPAAIALREIFRNH